MSIFGTIMSKIFGSDHPAASPPTGGAPPPSPTSPPASTASTEPTSGGASATQVDVAAILDGMAAKAGQKLNWRVSIVDLMKLLGMDSGLGSRKELAHELNYSGDTNDSAAMNIWLHKQVMTKFAKAGGKLPPDLAHH